MRFAVSLAFIGVLLLCQLCCKRADSFEAVFEGSTKAGNNTGLISTPELSGSLSGKTGDCVIQLYTGLNDTDAAQGYEFGEVHLLASSSAYPWAWIITDQISSNGLHLTSKDLRTGHRIRVTYETTEKKPRAIAKVELLNYARPTKVLLLSISTAVEGELKGKLSPESVEAVVITSLSWRLPGDVAILKSTEKAEGMAPIGELRVRYKLIESRTEWALRAYDLYESLDLETKLMDASASTNWDRLSFTGGFSPGGTSDVNDMTTAAVLTKVPSFEIHAPTLRKK